MMPFQPEKVIVERGSELSPIFRNLHRKLPQVPFEFVEDLSTPSENGSALSDPFGVAKRKL
ncbi:MAG TPA: hypothetical protein VGK77_16150, partial [Candidatus Binatia bacterium]